MRRYVAIASLMLLACSDDAEGGAGPSGAVSGGGADAAAAGDPITGCNPPCGEGSVCFGTTCELLCKRDIPNRPDCLAGQCCTEATPGTFVCRDLAVAGPACLAEPAGDACGNATCGDNFACVRDELLGYFEPTCVARCFAGDPPCPGTQCCTPSSPKGEAVCADVCP